MSELPRYYTKLVIILQGPALTMPQPGRTIKKYSLNETNFMAEVIITSENFEQEVLKSPVPVLVDFWAEWCGPCRVVGPVIAQLAEKYEGKFKVGKVNVDEQGDLAQKYQILSIPTLKFFKGGTEVDEIVGAAPATTIEATISKHLTAAPEATAA